jgi:hypothetical protein
MMVVMNHINDSSDIPVLNLPPKSDIFCPYYAVTEEEKHHAIE